MFCIQLLECNPQDGWLLMERAESILKFDLQALGSGDGPTYSEAIYELADSVRMVVERAQADGNVGSRGNSDSGERSVNVLAWNTNSGEVKLYQTRVGADGSCFLTAETTWQSQLRSPARHRAAVCRGLLNAALVADNIPAEDLPSLVLHPLRTPLEFASDVTFWEAYPCQVVSSVGDSTPARIFATVSDSVAFLINGFGVNEIDKLITCSTISVDRGLADAYGRFIMEVTREFLSDEVLCFHVAESLVELNREIQADRISALYPDESVEERLSALRKLCKAEYLLRSSTSESADVSTVAFIVWLRNRGQLRRVLLEVNKSGAYTVIADSVLADSVGFYSNR
jgi:hypothetical protein